MAEFLEDPVKLQNEGSQIFELIAPTCAEEGSRLEEGYQHRTGTGYFSRDSLTALVLPSKHLEKTSGVWANWVT